MDKGRILGSYMAYIRTGPGRNYPLIDPSNEYKSLLRNGVSFDIYEYNNSWCRHSLGGWSPMKDGNLTIIEVTKGDSIDGPSGGGSESATTQPAYSDGSSPTDQYSIYSTYNSTYDNTTRSNLLIKKVQGIFGMPYQFTSTVDPRLTDSVFGRKYSEKILAKLPVLLLSPGRPKFMKDFSQGEKEDFLKYISAGISGKIDDLISGEGKFYSFETNYADYYKGVNQMCRLAAKLMDVGDVEIPCGSGMKKLSSYTWQDYSNEAFRSFFASGPDTLGFYIDSETQISETFSNDSGQSMLAEKVNSLSELGREMQFLLGGVAGVEFDRLSQENYDETLSEFNSFASRYLSIVPDMLMKKLTSGVLTVATGGKMLFPEIWSDSSFSKNFSVNIKLRSPDADNLSLYLNIMVPLLHLIQFAGAQQLGTNSYSAPFLVRGHYKGMFTVDMGMISDMTITKGDQGKWTASGLPTQVDVNFTIKDLYPNMPLLQDPEDMIYNTQLVDYISNLCGINSNRPDILRMADIYISKFLTDISIKEKISNTFLSVEQSLGNALSNIYSSMF